MPVSRTNVTVDEVHLALIKTLLKDNSLVLVARGVHFPLRTFPGQASKTLTSLIE